MYPTEHLTVVDCTVLLMAVTSIWVIGIRKPVIKCLMYALRGIRNEKN